MYVWHALWKIIGSRVFLLSYIAHWLDYSLMQVKQPGLEMSTVQSELDLSYGQRYQGLTIPEAYERLILDT